MKKSLALLLTLTMIFALAACGGQSAPAAPQTPAEEAAEQPVEEAAPAEEPASAEEVELIVFAAASMTETLTKIKDLYEAANPGVKITYNFDSSGTLKTQIQEGADCDLFISAAPKQMNALDASCDKRGSQHRGTGLCPAGQPHQSAREQGRSGRSRRKSQGHRVL